MYEDFKQELILSIHNFIYKKGNLILYIKKIRLTRAGFLYVSRFEILCLGNMNKGRWFYAKKILFKNNHLQPFLRKLINM